MKMIDHNHFICHLIFGGHLLNIPSYPRNFYYSTVTDFARLRG